MRCVYSFELLSFLFLISSLFGYSGDGSHQDVSSDGGGAAATDRCATGGAGRGSADRSGNAAIPGDADIGSDSNGDCHPDELPGYEPDLDYDVRERFANSVRIELMQGVSGTVNRFGKHF